MDTAKTCEEYVLAELEAKKEQVKKLTAACKNYLEVMDDVQPVSGYYERASESPQGFRWEGAHHHGLCF